MYTLVLNLVLTTAVYTQLYLGTGFTRNEGGTQRGEIGLLLRPVPPDDIMNITAIAEKLRPSVVIQEPFEFAIRVAHTVKI
jgi:hypothetical protein